MLHSGVEAWVITTPFNMLSHCPVTSVRPVTPRPDLPTGMRIVGRTNCEENVFRAAIAYEKAVGGWCGAVGARPKL